MVNLIRKYQKQYYNEALLEHKYNAKAIFKITNKLLFKDESLPLPPELIIKLLADNFNNFFIAKIDRIQDDLTSTENNIMDNRCIEDHYLTDHRLIRFEPVDENYIAKLIKNTPPKLCALDPIPTQLLKRNVQEMAPYITTWNLSSQTVAQFPICHIYLNWLKGLCAIRKLHTLKQLIN